MARSNGDGGRRWATPANTDVTATKQISSGTRSVPPPRARGGNMIARIVVGDVKIKAFVPYAIRDIPKSFPGKQWDPSNKFWALPAAVADELADALRAAGCTVYVTRADGHPWKSGKTSHGHRSTPADGWADALFAAVGPDRGEQVFRALTKELHPDKGGDVTLQQQLNAARERAAFNRKKAS